MAMTPTAPTAPGGVQAPEDRGKVPNTALTTMRTAPTAREGIPTQMDHAEAQDSVVQMTMRTALVPAKAQDLENQDQGTTLMTLDHMVPGEDQGPEVRETIMTTTVLDPGRVPDSEDPVQGITLTMSDQMESEEGLDSEDLEMMRRITLDHAKVPGLEAQEITMETMLAQGRVPGLEDQDLETMTTASVLTVPGEVPGSEEDKRTMRIASDPGKDQDLVAQDQAMIQANTDLMVPEGVPGLDQDATVKMTTALVQMDRERAPDSEAPTLETAALALMVPGGDLALVALTALLAQGRVPGMAQAPMTTA